MKKTKRSEENYYDKVYGSREQKARTLGVLGKERRGENEAISRRYFTFAKCKFRFSSRQTAAVFLPELRAWVLVLRVAAATGK